MGLLLGDLALLSVSLSLPLRYPPSSNRIHRGALTAVVADRGSLPFRWLSRNLNSPVEKRVSLGTRWHKRETERVLTNSATVPLSGNNTTKWQRRWGSSIRSARGTGEKR